MHETPMVNPTPRIQRATARVAIAASVALAVVAGSLTGASATVAASSAPSGSPGPTGTPVPAATLHVTHRENITVDNARILSMSPDGTRFVAVSPVGDLRGSLCTYEVATSRQVACADLTPLAAGLRLVDVTWSPDGTKLAFSEQVTGTLIDGDLWVMDAVSGTLTNIADDGFAGEINVGKQSPTPGTVTFPANPAFTPDGTGVTYSRSTIINGEPAGNDIVTVPLSGGEPRAIVSVSARDAFVVDYGLRWAPDASRLYYSVQRAAGPDDPDNGIWVVNADGSDAHLLIGRPDDHSMGPPAVLQVASDGAHLLSWDLQNAYAFFRSPVFAVVDTSTGASTPLMPLDPATPSSASVDWAGFSPDGGSVLTLTNDGQHSLDARVRDVDGSIEHQLVLDEGTKAGIPFGIPMTWAPNGIVFITGNDNWGTATALTIEAGGPASSESPATSPVATP